MSVTDPRGLAEFANETSERGEWVRQESRFRDWIHADGTAPFPAETGRYHLYVSSACPWAHRAIIMRRLKGLEDAIGMTIVDPERDERGWEFRDGPGHSTDPVNGFRFLMEAYTQSDPSFDGRASTPVIWDTQSGRIVNNESGDVIRILNAEFDAWAKHPERDFFPEALREQVELVNARVYDTVNNGVYRCGFSTTQQAYDEAFDELFESLDWLEGRLSGQRYLVGEQLTEADLRLFVTLLRFDPVYYNHFKTNKRRIEDFPNLSNYLRELYQLPGVRDTVNMDHIKRHYFRTHPHINPTRIVPRGPDLDYDAPHDRERLPGRPLG